MSSISDTLIGLSDDVIEHFNLSDDYDTFCEIQTIIIDNTTK